MKAIYFTIIFIIISLCAEGQDITADISPSYDSDGAIDLHVNAGFGPYDFQWTQSSNPTIIATTEDLSNLEPGTYYVTVTDALCGIAEVRFEVKDCEIKIRIEDITRPSYVVQEECDANPDIYPLSNGSITISVNPPNPDYGISWSNNASGFYISDLSHGIYTVTVADGLCSETKSIELSACEYLIPLGADSICTTNPDVNNNGTIEVILDDKENVTIANPCMGFLEISTVNVGNILGFVSHWTGPNGFYSTDQDIYNLCEGSYCYFIDTGCGDEVDTCFSIVNCETNSIVISGETTVACPLDDVGTISLTISGGVSPFTLMWDNGLSGNFIDGLALGEYCVTVTDVNNCQKTECFTIDEGANPSCEDDDLDDDGIADVYDNCPEYYDPTNCCDIDGDALCLDVDPCPEDPDNLCIDTDSDGIVDIDDDCPNYYDPTNCCDIDEDGLCLDVDPCPGDPNNICVDLDGDGIVDIDDDCPNYYDPTNCCDIDEDGLCLDVDPCPEDPNNICIDSDGDGIVDIDDNCPNYNDPTNCCDIDGDGLCLNVDPCPEDPTNSCVTDSACCPSPSLIISHTFEGNIFTAMFKNVAVPNSCSVQPSFAPPSVIYSHHPTDDGPKLYARSYEEISPPPGYDFALRKTLTQWVSQLDEDYVDYIQIYVTLYDACGTDTLKVKLYNNLNCDLFNQTCPGASNGTGYDISHEDIQPTDGCLAGFIDGEWGWLDADGNVVSNEAVLVDFETGSYRFFAPCNDCPLPLCWDYLDLNSNCTDDIPIPIITVMGNDLTVSAPDGFSLNEIAWSTVVGDILSEDVTSAEISTNGEGHYIVRVIYAELSGDNCQYRSHYLFPDSDGDGISDINDECPEYYDPTNCCDIDGDGFCLDVDPCPGDAANSCVTDPACCPLNHPVVVQSDLYTINMKSAYVPSNCSSPGFSITGFYAKISGELIPPTYTYLNPPLAGYDISIYINPGFFEDNIIDYFQINYDAHNECGSYKGKYYIYPSQQSLVNSDDPLNNQIFTRANENLMNTIAFIRIFPNPFEDIIRIQISNENQDIDAIAIHDVNGKEIYFEKVSSVEGEFIRDVDLGVFPAGIYFLTITDSKGSIIKKERLVKM